jgi:hypothetical protein
MLFSKLSRREPVIGRFCFEAEQTQDDYGNANRWPASKTPFSLLMLRGYTGYWTIYFEFHIM